MADEITMATPKNSRVKAMHPAVRAAQQFREETKDFFTKDAPTQQATEQSVVQQPVIQQTEETELQYVPVNSIPLPEGYINFLSPNATPQNTSDVSDADSIRTKYEEENKKILAELEDTRRQLADARSKAQIPEDLRRLQEERSIDDLIQQAGLEFSSINTEDAKKLMAPVLSTLRKQTTDLEESFKKRLADTQARLDTTLDTLNQKQKQAQMDAAHKKILAAHPDLESLQKTEAYHKIMLSPVSDKSGLLVGQLVAAEYQRGNVDYVIELLNSIKGAKPSLDSIAGVSPNGVGTTPVADSKNTDGYLNDQEVANLNFAVQSGVMSRDEYRTVMKKHREAAKRNTPAKSN